LFEQALIYRTAADPSLVDIGLLAETLFFYSKTQLLLDRSSIIALAKQVPVDVLIELFDRNAIKLSYVRDGFAVMSSGGALSEHDFGAIQLAGRADGRKIKDHQEEIADALEMALGKTGDIRKMAKAIADRAILQKYKGVPQKVKAIPDLARADVEDAQFLNRAVATCLEHWIPNMRFSSPLRFRVFKTASGSYAVDTNLDYAALNVAYHKVFPPSHSSLSTAYLLAQIQSARADIFFAAYYMAEPVTGALSGAISKLKHFEFLRRRELNAQEIELFHEIVVPDVPSIRDAVNSGERTMADFLKFLDQSSKFKSMLTDTSPDLGLIRTYNNEVSKKSWVETLPGKTIRFMVASAAGFAANAFLPGAGLAVGATNTFFADKILKGWRPNRFIEGPYRKFVAGAK